MPRYSDRAQNNCPRCGTPMTWTENAARTPDLLAGSAAGEQTTSSRLDAYRCDNGHVSERCVVCQSYDTAVWGKSTNPPQFQANCNTCGNAFVVEDRRPSRDDAPPS
jgi:endogenous inhibitor of DNA gyrase (YacG/DUF329 family)